MQHRRDCGGVSESSRLLVVTTPAGADILRTCRSEHLDGGSAQHRRPEQIASCGPVPAVRLRGRSLPGAVSQLRVATPANRSLRRPRASSPRPGLRRSSLRRSSLRRSSHRPSSHRRSTGRPSKEHRHRCRPRLPRRRGAGNRRLLLAGAGGPASRRRRLRTRDGVQEGPPSRFSRWWEPLLGGRRRHLASPERIV